MSFAQQFLDRFINNANAYALQTNTGAYKAYRNQSITTDLLERHLLGEITIGVYAINPFENTARFLVWDCDTEAETQFTQLIGWLSSFGINSLRESIRGGRSGHLWVLLERPILAADAFRILKHGQFLWQIPGEVFPAQASLRSAQVGSLVRLPLGRHQKPSAGGVWGLFEACPVRAVDYQLRWFLEQPTNDVSSLLATIPKIVELPRQKRSKSMKHTGDLIAEFPENWEWKGVGPELSGPCPACRELGWDAGGGNLSLNTEQNVLYCHRTGSNHSFRQILKAARYYKDNFTKVNIVSV